MKQFYNKSISKSQIKAGIGVLAFLMGAATFHWVRTWVVHNGSFLSRSPSDDGSQERPTEALETLAQSWETQLSEATVELTDALNELRGGGGNPSRARTKANAVSAAFSNVFAQFALEITQSGPPDQINRTLLGLFVVPLDRIQGIYERNLALIGGVEDLLPGVNGHLSQIRLRIPRPYADVLSEEADELRRTHPNSTVRVPGWDYFSVNGVATAQLKIDALAAAAASTASLLANPSERGIWNELREQAIRMTMMTKVKFEGLLFSDERLPFQLPANTGTRHRALLARAQQESIQDPYLSLLVPVLTAKIAESVSQTLPSAAEVAQNPNLFRSNASLRRVGDIFYRMIHENMEHMDLNRLVANGIISEQMRTKMQSGSASERRAMAASLGVAAIRWFLADHAHQPGWQINIASSLQLAQMRLSDVSLEDARRLLGEQIIGDKYNSLFGSIMLELMSKEVPPPEGEAGEPTIESALSPTVEFRYIIELNQLASDLGLAASTALWPTLVSDIANFKRMSVEPVMLSRDRLVHRLVSGAQHAQVIARALLGTRGVATVDPSSIPEEPDFLSVVSAVGRTYAPRAGFAMELLTKLVEGTIDSNVHAPSQVVQTIGTETPVDPSSWVAIMQGVTRSAFSNAEAIKLAFDGNSARRQVVIRGLSRQLRDQNFRYKSHLERAMFARRAVGPSNDAQLVAALDAIIVLARMEAEYKLPSLRMGLERILNDLFRDRDYAFISFYETIEASKNFVDEHANLVITLLGPRQARAREMRNLLTDIGIFRNYLTSSKERLALELPFLFEEVTIPHRIMRAVHMRGARKVPFWELIVRLEAAASRMGLRTWFPQVLATSETRRSVQNGEWNRDLELPGGFEQLLIDALQGIDEDTGGGVMGRFVRFVGQTYSQVVDGDAAEQDMVRASDWPATLKVRDVYWEQKRLTSEDRNIRRSVEVGGVMRALTSALIPVVLKMQLRYVHHDLTDFLDRSKNLNSVLLDSMAFENISMLAGAGGGEPSAELRALELRYEDMRNEVFWFRRMHGGLKMITTQTQEYSHPVFMTTILFDLGGFLNTLAHKYMFASMLFDLSADSLASVEYWQTYGAIEPYAHTNALGTGLFSSDQLDQARSQFEFASEGLMGRLPWDVPWIIGNYRQSSMTGRQLGLRARQFAHRSLRAHNREALRRVMAQKADTEILMREVGIRRAMSQSEIETLYLERKPALERQSQAGDRRATRLLADWQQLRATNREMETTISRLRSSLVRSERVQLSTLRASAEMRQAVQSMQRGH